MSIPTRLVASLRLPVWFTVLAGIPLAALGWLGWRLLVQERALEQQRQRERLEDAAGTLAHDLDRALARWEDLLPAVASGESVSLPPDVAALAFDDHGIQRHLGLPLPYYPIVPVSGGASSGLFTEAETLEFARGDVKGAEAAYRRLSAASDKRVRAEALMRLARCLRKEQRLTEALAVYDALAELGETAIAGSPSGLVARRERVALRAQMGQADAAARESQALAGVLSSGRYRIDRATFDFYRESALLPPMPGGTTALARGVDEVWSLWRQQPTGRVSVVTDRDRVVAVWRRSPVLTAAIVGRVDALVAAAGMATREDLLVSFEDPSGGVVWGATPNDRSSSVRTSRETGLPWTLRVASVNASPVELLASSRRNLLVAGFALMALVVAAASYAVFRSVNRELSIARLQSDFVATVSLYRHVVSAAATG